MSILAGKRLAKTTFSLDIKIVIFAIEINSAGTK
jgi:hypothetical protein